MSVTPFLATTPFVAAPVAQLLVPGLLVAASRPWAVIWVLVVAAALLTGLGVLLLRRS